MANRIDFAGIKDRLLPNAKSLLQEWLPGGVFEGNEYKALNPTRNDNSIGSFSINWKNGEWMDGAVGKTGGDLIALYAYINGIKQGEAANELSTKYLGGNYVSQNDRPKPPQKDDDGSVLCLPVPKGENIPEVPPKPHGRTPSMIHTYTDATGQIMCLIYRFEAGNGQQKKSFIPFTCWRNKSGLLHWKNKHIPENRPLYGLEELAKYSDYPVLVVSGEKCVDAARKNLRGYVAVTWMNGDQSTGKTDFTPLKGRKLIWWPDNDIQSKNVMRTLANTYGGRVLNIEADRYPKGWDCADAVAEGVDLEKFINTDVVIQYPSLEVAMPQELLPHTLQMGKGKVKVQGTLLNLKTLLKYYGIEIWYNVIKDSICCRISGGKVLDSSRHYYSKIDSTCVLNEFPKFDLKNYIRDIAVENSKNPVEEWINSTPYMGGNNDSLINISGDMIHCDNSLIDPKLKKVFWKKWLISAYAMVTRKDGDDKRTRGVLVFQGGQGIGKTAFLKSLCGEKWGGSASWFGEGSQFNPSNKDDLIKTQKFWIVELAELESVFKSSRALPALKAFLTNPSNTVRIPYGIDPDIFYSRTVYAGTVNQMDFLVDDTGNDRFWCLPVIEFDDKGMEKINVQQLWAEVKLWCDNEMKMGRDYIWWLSPEERDMLNANNRQYNVCSTARDYITQKLNWNAPRNEWRDKTCTIILKDVCGMPNVTNADARSAAYVMREMLGMDKAPKLGSHGARVYPCPPAKVEPTMMTIPAQPTLLSHWSG